MITMTGEHKLAMKKKTRAIRGIVTVLLDDAEYMKIDAEDFDLVSLTESIRETKDTLDVLRDHVAELEYLIYLTNGGN